MDLPGGSVAGADKAALGNAEPLLQLFEQMLVARALDVRTAVGRVRPVERPHRTARMIDEPVKHVARIDAFLDSELEHQ